MKEKGAEKKEEFPETPPWTMFFDGPLYQKYDEFMKTKDFSKILLNTKLRLANSNDSELVTPPHSIDEDHWDKEQDADPTGNTYQYVSADYFQRTKEDEKRRTRRTRAFILIGFVTMAALAFGTALVIHYIFIPPWEERNPENFVNVSFSGNTTASGVIEITQTTPGPVDEHGHEMTGLLDKLLEDTHHHPHHHDHAHVVNQDGKIFDDHFLATSPTTLETTTGASEATTEVSSTQLQPNNTEMYVLNLKPETKQDTKIGDILSTTPEPNAAEKPKQYTSTIELNHMDFFSLDESQTTASYSTSTFTEDEYFIVDETTTNSAVTGKLTTDSASVENLQLTSEDGKTAAVTTFSTISEDKLNRNVTEAITV